MKDLTNLEPEWFNSNRIEFRKNAITKLNVTNRDTIEFKVYSKICHKCIISVYYRLNDSNVDCVYDFDNDTYITIRKCRESSLYFRSGDKHSWDYNDHTTNFIYADVYTGHVNEFGEYDETYKFILDSKFNNAPNLSGKDVLDINFRTSADIVGDLLYFEYDSTRYLIDGDYNIIAKFPKKLDIIKNQRYVNSNTKHFILKSGNGWCLYDVNKKEIIVKNIIAVGETNDCDFKTKSGDIYKYDSKTGEFFIESKYDPFCDDLKEVQKFVYGCYDISNLISKVNNRTIIHIMKNKNGKFFIVHNNKVINKNCPFDSVILKKNEFNISDSRFICKVGDIEDVYVSYDKFKFNSINLSGEKTKLWFDKD